MQMITGNWKNPGVDHKTFTQVGDNGYNITTGSAFDKKAVEYSCSVHTSSNEVYPHKSNKRAVVTNVAHALLFFPHKAVTASGNAFGVVKGLVMAVKNRSEKDFKFISACSPVLSSAKQMLIDGTIALTGVAAYTGSFELYGYGFGTDFGWNLAQVAVVGTVGLAVLHGLHNPQGYQRTIHNRVERFVDPKPISDNQAHDMKWHQRAFSLLDGSYSLTRLLGMHYMGKADMAVDSKKRFEAVKES